MSAWIDAGIYLIAPNVLIDPGRAAADTKPRPRVPPAPQALRHADILVDGFAAIALALGSHAFLVNTHHARFG